MKTAQYQIKLAGELHPRLAVWFGDFTLCHTPQGESLLTGPLPDQAALHGVLARCRDLGLSVISVNPLPDLAPAAPAAAKQPGDENEQHDSR
jgi:hypothetical protein